jgi:hypothetical protein
MDGAGADDDDQALAVLPMQNAANGVSGFNNQRGCLVGNRELGFDGARGWERLDFDNVLVVERSLHSSVFSHLRIAFYRLAGAMSARRGINIADIEGNIHWRRFLTAGDVLMGTSRPLFDKP